MKVNMLRTLPYEIPHQIFEKIAELNSKAVNSGFGVNGWPITYAPTLEKCSLCGTSLPQPHPHPGQNKGHSAMLLTNVVPFEPVTIQIKQCSKCSAMYQVFPFQCISVMVNINIVYCSFNLILWQIDIFKCKLYKMELV